MKSRIVKRSQVPLVAVFLAQGCGAQPQQLDPAPKLARASGDTDGEDDDVTKSGKGGGKSGRKPPVKGQEVKGQEVEPGKTVVETTSANPPGLDHDETETTKTEEVQAEPGSSETPATPVTPNPDIPSSSEMPQTAPVAALEGAPVWRTRDVETAIDVLGDDGLTKYRYKIGAASDTDCNGGGYLPAEGAPENSDIRADLTAYAGEEVTLCVIGGNDAGLWQEPSSATSRSWTIDTTEPLAPAALEAERSGTSVALSWTAAAALEGERIEYLVVRKTGATVAWKPMAGKSYAIGEDLGNGQTVAYRGNAKAFADTIAATAGDAYYAAFALDDVYNYSPASKATTKTVITTFAFTGAAQTFVVPFGVTKLKIKAWGAGGGGSDNGGGLPGGGGAYASGGLAVSAGESLAIIVGGGGVFTNRAGGGGGRTGVQRDDEELLTAAGGGGAGCVGAGGAGGADLGESGSNQYSGHGGSLTAGGTPSPGSLGVGSPGIAYAGGIGSQAYGAAGPGGYGGGGNAGECTGGGGGGYYGGAGGSRQGGADGGGGGGSSVTTPGGTTEAGTGIKAGGDTDSERGSAGNGGAPLNAGANGKVVVSYQTKDPG